MTRFRRYVMHVEAVPVNRPFKEVAALVGGAVLKDGRREVGVILPNKVIAHEGWFVVRKPDGLQQAYRPDAFTNLFTSDDGNGDTP